MERERSRGEKGKKEGSEGKRKRNGPSMPLPKNLKSHACVVFAPLVADAP